MGIAAIPCRASSFCVRRWGYDRRSVMIHSSFLLATRERNFLSLKRTHICSKRSMTSSIVGLSFGFSLHISFTRRRMKSNPFLGSTCSSPHVQENGLDQVPYTVDINGKWIAKFVLLEFWDCPIASAPSRRFQAFFRWS